MISYLASIVVWGAVAGVAAYVAVCVLACLIVGVVA